ncbi:cysteine desulfurase family protein [Actinomadura sp. 3N508]|uniref:cysteine desulfurase family protein n=1 Tax=Actinomadura sp. 3N508 TaxID=3375153 RepID=UPI0037992789
MSGRPEGLRDEFVYLDYNATTPVDPRVVEAMQPYLGTHFANPSSDHALSRQPRQALTTARRQIADLIGAHPEGIVFTGGGSVADTLAVRGAALRHRDGPAHVITQVTEHPAVLETCRALNRLHGVEVTHLPVDAHGRVDPDDLARALTPRTAVVSIMTANNETGVLQPIAELAAAAHERGALFHTDAAQAAGKIPLDVTGLDVDLLTIAGHKMYAPKGIGALYVRPGLDLEPAIYGGGQERGLHAGTEPVASAVALGTAAHLAATDLRTGEPARLTSLRDRLHQRLSDLLPGRVHLNGHPEHRLPGTLNISITGTRGDRLLASAPGIAAATGSACHSDSPEPSPVLLAMGHDHDRALAALRLTLGRWSTQDETDQAAQQIADSAHALLTPPGS